MARWCNVGVQSNAIIGKSIEIDELFDNRILVERVKIEPTKFPGKNASGLRMQMQVINDAIFHDKPDKDGDYYEKDADGRPKGTRRSCFTGSDSLMGQIRDGEASFVPQQTEAGGTTHFYPLDTTIVKVGKCFQFT